MTDRIFTQSQLPIRRSVDLLPEVFKTESNSKFLAGVLDPLIQPGVLEKTVGYIGRRFGKTYKSQDVYLDTDATLRSAYQLEPGVVIRKNDNVERFYDYIDFKNQLKFFGNNLERDDLFTEQDHYSWNPPIEWDKFVNYREYFWVPMGPPSVRVLGQSQKVTSTYRVRLGDSESWVLTPDGLTPNPTITLYRGQTYVFNVNAPKNSFYIRSAADVGASANYTKGVTNSGTENGKVTFVVPLDAPDILYYQSNQEPTRHGRFLIDNVESNSKINVTNEVIGKETYTSSNGVVFTNGLVVEFIGQTLPAKYATGRWLVEGVGSAINLINLSTLRVPVINQNNPEVLFDNSGFDTDPFDDASSYPGTKDYITINRGSIDSNPWSRYNRWFHRSVLEYAHSLNGTEVDLAETVRAKRPIIEFRANLQLFNHGAKAKAEVDYVDTYTTDVFSTIEGSPGYNIDGEFLFDGARILITADTDSWANNKIYQVNFIKHINTTQISLTETTDTVSNAGDCVLVKRGNANAGLMYHFTGDAWKLSQRKTAINQAPKFDVVDSNGVSFGDAISYPVTSFTGSELVSYKIGTATTDTELGFKLSYLNIDNVGDIQFEFDWDFDSFTWQQDQTQNIVFINTGFYLINNSLSDVASKENGWTSTDKDYLQAIIGSYTITSVTDTVVSTACEWTGTTNEKIIFYLNGSILLTPYTRPSFNTFVFAKAFAINDVVTIKVYSDQNPDLGYYQIPLGLERNPLNEDLTTFTLGQATDHAGSMVELADGFAGAYPGVGNLRDLGNFQHRGRRFLKHSNASAFSITALCAKEGNIIRATQYAKKSYSEFKNNFLTLALELYYDQEPIDFVDEIIEAMTKAKRETDPFSDSDMIGSGAYTKVNYIVEDEGIKTFALNEKFDLTTLSRRAVYVYINNEQSLVNVDYTFNSTFGFVTILRTLVEGDEIEIREYVSTAFNFIPATPTSLGLYKKFTPVIYTDDTYQTPTKVIQGHDGSLTVAYNDIRDVILLELEKRIYNNIKREYNEDLFNIDTTLGGYYGNAIYGKPEVDAIISGEFLKWVSNTDVDYVSNQYFDDQNSFTYTYSNMTDPTRQQSLPGFWRGVYLWFYDTDRPHVRPWEMLGFSEEPTWWVSEYGPAPYTSGNMILWEDLEAGIIRQGTRAGSYDRYKRPGLVNHIPVNGDGKLLSPLDSGLAQDFTLINNRGDFILGDVSPAEYAWRRSSEYPFAIAMALSLLRPFDFIIKFLDPSQYTKNEIGQLVNLTTGKFTRLEDIVLPISGERITTGMINWAVDYLKSKSLTVQVLQDTLDGTNVHITSRLRGFVDQEQQKYLLDSKSPKSTSSSVFIPQENYDIFFNVSVPISSISYSGVIFEKTAAGWRVTGYDSLTPYFNYFEAAPTQTDPLISVGGVSEAFAEWTSGKYYNNGQIVRNAGFYYRTISSHTSGDLFDNTYFKRLAKLPQVGAVEALKRRSFNTLSLQKLGYGTVLTSIQAVVDFLLGYEQYLKSIGMVFDQYDTTSQTAKDWFTSAKEFMFWTKHNWAEGSLLTVSPAADFVEINIPIGVADNLLDSFYEYQIFKSDGTPLLPNFINVNRDIQKITVSKTNTTDGIYFIKINFVLKEHVVVFSDRTVFNDVIYDKATGYRQDRIKVRGFRTTDWDGDYTSPGFLFDNVNIQTWAPFTDYKLGDIVAYREFNWTSQVNQAGTETFNNANWSRLDSTPTKGLVSNFDYKINQFDDYYDLDADGVGSSQRSLARHAIGYQQRDYLQNLAEDEVSQFKLYQGFIREKGTNNAITKVFDKLSNSTGSSVTLYEEWALRVGRFGGTDQLTETEFLINKSELSLNPQPILIVNSTAQSSSTDEYIRLTQPSFTVAPTPFSTNINPTYDFALPGRSAGYVKNDQVEFVVKSRDDILNLNIANFRENNNVWVTFDNSDWTVLRYNISDLILTATDSLDGEVLDPPAPFLKVDDTVTINLNRRHYLAVGDIIGIREVTNLTGFFKITGVTSKTVTFDVPAGLGEPALANTSYIRLRLFSEARYKDYSSLEFGKIGILKGGSKLWVDQNANSQWEVIEKTNQYSSLEVTDFGVTNPTHAGQTVVYIDTLKQIVASLCDNNLVVTYNAARPVLNALQFISPPLANANDTNGSFGAAIAVSADNRWMVVASPYASGVQSTYRGVFNVSATYQPNDIVVYNGSLWSALVTVVGDGSTIDLDSYKWKPTTLSLADSTGTNAGYSEQGMLTVYEYGSVETVSVAFDSTVVYSARTIVTYQGRQYIALTDTTAGTLPTDATVWAISSGRWNEKFTLISPRPEAYEKFGSKLSIAGSNGNYTLAVTAPGAQTDTGRVYLYKYSTNGWEYLQDPGYSGVFSTSLNYVAGSIVWFNNNLWIADADFVHDGSTTPVSATSGWTELGDVPVQAFLPSSSAVSESTYKPEQGLDSSTDLVELVKAGDMFGSSVVMNATGSTLVIGAPFSDSQYFENYKGEWETYQTYTTNDVVKSSAVYYKVKATVASSTGESPVSNPLIWDVVGNESGTQSGKVFVYKKNTQGKYKLAQTINAGSLAAMGVSVADQFGHCVDLDAAGNTLVVSAPFADNNYQNQGAVFVFYLNETTGEYQFIQRLESYEVVNNENFGNSISISNDSKRIVVGAQNSPYKTAIVWTTPVTFDAESTTFSKDVGSTGQVYVFERKDTVYMLSEKLDVDLQLTESFGASVDCTNSVIVVGSPNFNTDVVETGKVRLFTKSANVDSWNTITSQESLVNIGLLQSLAVYDNVNNIKLADVDIVDHFKLKILGIAEQEIKFKTPYDPATYMVGTDNQIIDADQAWFEQNVGLVWWNIATAKWTWYEQGDVAYRTGNWNQLAVGASIDVYEWVESILTPSEWAAIADTNEGLAEGISGQPLYADDTVYNFKEQINSTTGAIIGTKYYYWVKNKTTLPDNPQRRTPTSEVASLIANPVGYGYPVIALIAADKLLAYNLDSLITSDTALVNLQYAKTNRNLNEVHSEYQLLAEGNANSTLASTLETKWIDSLIGFDSAGNQIPDPNLPAKQKYGVEFRPRQSMFVSRSKALRIVVDKVNAILMTQPFTESLSFGNLGSIDPAPVEALNLYDQAVDTYIDLETVGTARLRQAILQANIVNGQVDTIDVIDSGFGYKVAPPVDIQGTGVGAEAIATIDNQGRITSVKVTQPGKKYSSVILRVRSFSVLVKSDSTSNNFWTVYAWDQKSKTFYRSMTQEYNTTQYWNTVDWWATGYGITSRIIKEVSTLFLETELALKDGDLLRVKEYGNGGWAVLEKVPAGGEVLNKYKLVGRQAGTIQLKESLYNLDINNVGYDNIGSYDSIPYDQQPITELRNIFKAIKDDLLINELLVEWNNLFFTSLGYVFSEQLYVDWAFKTSFMSAIHNVGDLAKKTNYKNDNLESFKDYINEVKPYRTKVREYTSQYTEYQPANSAVTDFDNPVVYSEQEGKVISIGEDSEQITTYPWKWWLDNKGYSVVDIRLSNAGSGYTSIPSVIIESTSGSGATAQAYVSNGKVSGITVLNAGSGYLTAPTISIVGGNGSNAPAKATAIVGEGKVRNFNMSIKFDRVSKTGNYSDLTHEENFIASGASSVFDLSYAPTRDKSKITVLKNNELVFNSEYTISLYTSTTDTYSLLRGKIQFNTAPVNGDAIQIVYEKNDLLLDAVNRIEKFYSPTTGMLGFNTEKVTLQIDTAVINSQRIELRSAKEIKEGMRLTGTGVVACRVEKIVSAGHIIVSKVQNLPAGSILEFSYNNPNQLMTGIDFGGVMIQGNPFDVTGGWDALPWFTDSWDSVESSADIYIVADGSTGYVTLPIIPEAGQQFSIYIKRVGSSSTTRIDAADFNESTGTSPTNSNAVMQTYEGNGVTAIVDLPNTLVVDAGDTIIFRTLDSDGTVKVSDVNLIDTNLSGGTLETMRGAYITATGRNAEDIIIDGEKFISPDQVPATEENVPGQVLDSVSIKVFHSKLSGAPSMMATVFPTVAGVRTYSIGQSVIEHTNVIVYLDKVKQTGYTIDFAANTITFATAPVTGKILEIVSVGIGGLVLLDYEEFTTDGTDRLFLTNANYQLTKSVLVTVDGHVVDAAFSNSRGQINNVDKTLVEIALPPDAGSTVKIIALGSSLSAAEVPAIRVNQQTVILDGSTRSYALDNFVDLGRSSSRGSVIIEKDGVLLKSSDTAYVEYNGIDVINLGDDPVTQPGSISISDLKVYKNDQLIGYITDWTFDGTTNQLNLVPSKFAIGDKLRIEVNINTDYSIENNLLVLSPELTIADGDNLLITWFTEYPTVGMVKEVYTGGKSQYPLSRKPVSISYLWVYKNGQRLTQDVDYILSVEKNVVVVLAESTLEDRVEIVQFGTDVYQRSVAYEVFKDMLNTHHFKRYSINEVKLASTLNYFDTTLTVTDATNLGIPNAQRRVPGIVEINGERIEYFTKTGNVLGQLRRGSLGTAIAELHAVGSNVVDLGNQESIPYIEEQEKYNVVSDGSTLAIPVDFTPTKSNREFYRLSAQVTSNGVTSILYPSIPLTYGACDEVEVFVGGKRLNKSATTVYSELNAASSPEADITLEAEFSVDGVSNHIRLTNPVPAGIMITILRRVGRTWYETGATTASKGVTLLDNDTVIINFIEQKTTLLP